MLQVAKTFIKLFLLKIFIKKIKKDQLELILIIFYIVIFSFQVNQAFSYQKVRSFISSMSYWSCLQPSSGVFSLSSLSLFVSPPPLCHVSFSVSIPHTPTSPSSLYFLYVSKCCSHSFYPKPKFAFCPKMKHSCPSYLSFLSYLFYLS